MKCGADKPDLKAIQVIKTSDKQSAAIVNLAESDLMPGDVTVQLEYSTVNDKDALAITGAIPFMQKFPLIPGIDFAGMVQTSSNTNFKKGDKVVLNGYGLGEAHHGDLAQDLDLPAVLLSFITRRGRTVVDLQG